MRRTKFFMSGLTTVLMAVVLCLSMSACGGSSSDDDYDDGIDIDRNIDDNHSNPERRTKGVHQVDVSFSGDTEGWDVQLYFISADKNGSETHLFYGGEEKNGRFYIKNDYSNCTVKTTDQAYWLICEVTLTRKSTSANPVKVKMSSKVNDKAAYSEEYVADPKYKKVIFHYASQVSTSNFTHTEE